jgi:hypothetical protein
VPETAVYEDSQPTGSEHNVRSYRHAVSNDPQVLTETQTAPMQLGAQAHLRLGVDTPIGLHDLGDGMAARRRVEVVIGSHAALTS